MKGLKLRLRPPHGESAPGLEEGPRGDLSTTRLHKGPASSPTDRGGSKVALAPRTFHLLVMHPAATKPSLQSIQVCFSLSCHGFRRSRTI